MTELDNDTIVGITLGGSYVRGEATPYSDVDLACWVKDAVNLSPRRFVYRDNRLISIVNFEILRAKSAQLCGRHNRQE